MDYTSRGRDTYEEASKRDRRNSQGLMEVSGHVVKEIFGLQEKKKNCWTFFAAAAQVYGGRIHESVESVEMISSYEIRAASIRKRGFRAVFDQQSQGVCVCDYMHWSFGFLHVLQVIGTESIVEHKGEGFHGVLGLNLHGISVAGGVLIYVGISARWYSLVSVKGVEEGLKKIDSCGFVYRTRYYKAAIFRGNTVWFSKQICVWRNT
ncbi:unnamed protein product [Brassica oleracea]